MPRTKTATKKTVPAKKKVPKSSAVSKDPQEDSDPRNMGTENEVTVVKHKITDSGNKIRYDCAFKDGLGTSKDLEPIKVCLDSPSKIIRYCERHPIAAELTCKNLMGHFDNDPQKLLKKKGERTKVINCHDAIKKIAKDYRGSQKAKADEEAAKQKKVRKGTLHDFLVALLMLDSHWCFDGSCWLLLRACITSKRRRTRPPWRGALRHITWIQTMRSRTKTAMVMLRLKLDI